MRQMRFLKFKLISVLLVIGLVLTGCYELVNIASVLPNGKLSGEFSVSIPLEGTELLSISDTYLDGIQIDEMQFTEAIPTSESTFDNISKCELYGLRISVQNAPEISWAFVNISYVPEDESKTLYLSGYLEFRNMVDQTSFFEINPATVVPVSGNAADCSGIQNMTSGTALYASEETFGTLGLGNQEPIYDSTLQYGVSLLQLNNLPEADRAGFSLLTSLFTIPKGDDWEIPEQEWRPEIRLCVAELDKPKYNALTTQTFAEGRLEKLVNKSNYLHLTITEEKVTATCKYKNVDMTFADRGVNEWPQMSASPNAEGHWWLADNNLIWNFNANLGDALQIDYMKSDETFTVHEINPKGNLSTEERNIYNYIKQTGYKNTYKLSGVVLDTSGNYNQKNNSVTFYKRGALFDWIGQEAWYIKGKLSPDWHTIELVNGLSVRFNENKTTLSNVNSLTSLKSQLIDSPVINLRIVGIYDGSIRGKEKIEANEELVADRVKTIKKQLKKMKVKANISIGFVLDESNSSGDSNAEDKVVIQINPVIE